MSNVVADTDPTKEEILDRKGSCERVIHRSQKVIAQSEIILSTGKYDMLIQEALRALIAQEQTRILAMNIHIGCLESQLANL